MKQKIVLAIAVIAALASAAWGGYVFCTQANLGELQELYVLIPLYVVLVAL